MSKEERRDEFERIISEANEAKDRLARVADKLEELGYTRKAKSCFGNLTTNPPRRLRGQEETYGGRSLHTERKHDLR